MRRLTFRTLVSLVACAAALPHAAAAQDGLAVGDVPEPIVLETLDGEPVDLREFSGEKPVLLEFWATWCAVCRALESSMRSAHEAYGEEVDFVLVAAAVAQSRDQVRDHLARRPLPAQVLWDTRGRFTRAYDAPGTGYVIILDADGSVAYAGTGPDQDLSAALASVLQKR